MWLASCDLATLLLWGSWKSEFFCTSCDSGAQSNSCRTLEFPQHFVHLSPPPLLMPRITRNSSLLMPPSRSFPCLTLSLTPHPCLTLPLMRMPSYTLESILL